MPNPISARQLERLFPHASQSCRELNSNYGTGQPCVGSTPKTRPETQSVTLPRKHITITLTGQIRGGKNNMIVTRKGKHIPKEEWKNWRDEKVREVLAQLPWDWEPFREPLNIMVHYVAGDRKRRDMPAILDSVFHVLEKAGFVEDDTLLWVSRSTREYDKQNPRLAIMTEWESKGLNTQPYSVV